MSEYTDFDVVIVGAGMVGSSLALALASTPLNVALVEAQDIQLDHQPSYDDRGIALSYGSQRILQTLGLWPQLKAHATPIQQIHISDRGHFGVTRMHAKQAGVPALGQVLTAKSLGQQLNHAVRACPAISLMSPISVTAVDQQPQQVNLCLSDGQRISSRLLVAADGQQSTIRQLLSIESWHQDYQQTAITANVSTQRPHNHQAFERFTDTGPLALLPMSDNRCSLIWTVKTVDHKAMLAWSDDDFLYALQQRFGMRLGFFQRIGKRYSYPLGLTQSHQTVVDRTVIIGNAAHSLHPIAGQGFNLGLRDAAVLAETLAAHINDCGQPACLEAYQHWQVPAQQQIIRATDFLVRSFSNANPILGHSRSAMLAALDCLPLTKRLLTHNSMGLAGRQSRLSRGLPL